MYMPFTQCKWQHHSVRDEKKRHHLRNFALNSESFSSTFSITGFANSKKSWRVRTILSRGEQVPSIWTLFKRIIPTQWECCSFQTKEKIRMRAQKTDAINGSRHYSRCNISFTANFLEKWLLLVTFSSTDRSKMMKLIKTGTVCWSMLLRRKYWWDWWGIYSFW